MLCCCASKPKRWWCAICITPSERTVRWAVGKCGVATRGAVTPSRSITELELVRPALTRQNPEQFEKDRPDHHPLLLYRPLSPLSAYPVFYIPAYLHSLPSSL